MGKPRPPQSSHAAPASRRHGCAQWCAEPCSYRTCPCRGGFNGEATMGVKNWVRKVIPRDNPTQPWCHSHGKCNTPSTNGPIFHGCVQWPNRKQRRSCGLNDLYVLICFICHQWPTTELKWDRICGPLIPCDNPSSCHEPLPSRCK